MKNLRFYLFFIICLFFCFGCFHYLGNSKKKNNDDEHGFIFGGGRWEENIINRDTTCLSEESDGDGIFDESFVDSNGGIISEENISDRSYLVRAKSVNVGGIRDDVNKISEEIKIEKETSSVEENNNFGKRNGIVLYEIPDTMKVGNSYVAKLRISDGGGEIILEGLDVDNVSSNKKIKVIKSRVGRIMGVKLSNIGGEKDFDIRLLNSEVQVIEEGNSYTSWDWVITPLVSGNKKLKMVIIIKEGDFVKDIPVYEDYIHIRNSPGFYLWGFLEKYWQWLLGTIIIPLFLFIWRKKRSSKSLSS